MRDLLDAMRELTDRHRDGITGRAGPEPAHRTRAARPSGRCRAAVGARAAGPPDCGLVPAWTDEPRGPTENRRRKHGSRAAG